MLYFQVVDPAKVAYAIANLPDALEKLTQTTLRNVIGGMDLDSTLTSRDRSTRNSEWSWTKPLKSGASELRGLNSRTSILRQKFREAMEKQMRAERDRRAIVLEASGQRQARILQSEGIRDAEINRAEGAKKAKILVADGEAAAASESSSR